MFKLGCGFGFVLGLGAAGLAGLGIGSGLGLVAVFASVLIDLSCEIDACNISSSI